MWLSRLLTAPRPRSLSDAIELTTFTFSFATCTTFLLNKIALSWYLFLFFFFVCVSVLPSRTSHLKPPPTFLLSPRSQLFGCRKCRIPTLRWDQALNYCLSSNPFGSVTISRRALLYKNIYFFHLYNAIYLLLHLVETKNGPTPESLPYAEQTLTEKGIYPKVHLRLRALNIKSILNYTVSHNLIFGSGANIYITKKLHLLFQRNKWNNLCLFCSHLIENNLFSKANYTFKF